MYKNDSRIIMTVDAGGQSFVFTAIQNGRTIIDSITLPAYSNTFDACINSLVDGFTQVRSLLPEPPTAISFAFPGPADYPAGIIGDAPNFPLFRGGVALGPYIQDKFNIPVFINNDGDLFAYGEALMGELPEINRRLKAENSIKQYKNLLGLTLGTGFGAGVVINGNLLIGDNSAGGDIWCFKNQKYPDYIVEDSVSIRAVQRVYRELSHDSSCYSPKEIFEIAKGQRDGNHEAAIGSFNALGEAAGEAICPAITLIDGIVVLGGGIANAAEFIVPAIIKVLNGNIKTMGGDLLNRLQMKAYNLDDPQQFTAFAKGGATKIKLPFSSKTIDYDPVKRIGITTSKQGTNHAICMGAYVYALQQLSNSNK